MSGVRARAGGLLAGGILGLGLAAGLGAALADGDPATDTVGDAAGLVIPYDGTLRRGGAPFTGTALVRFALHGGPDCADCEVWAEEQTVAVRRGRFSVGLGSVTPIADAVLDGEGLFLGLTVEGRPLGGRQPLRPLPFTWWAANGSQMVAGALDLAGRSIEDVATVRGAAGAPVVMPQADLGGALQVGNARPVARGDAEFVLDPDGAHARLRVDGPLEMRGELQAFGAGTIQGDITTEQLFGRLALDRVNSFRMGGPAALTDLSALFGNPTDDLQILGPAEGLRMGDFTEAVGGPFTVAGTTSVADDIAVDIAPRSQASGAFQVGNSFTCPNAYVTRVASFGTAFQVFCSRSAP